MSDIDLKINNVLDMFCRYIKDNLWFECNIRREIITLEGEKIIADKIEQIDQVAVGSTALHETEIMRSTTENPVTHITFMKPTICHIEASKGQWGEHRRLKCIDWDKQ